MGKGRTIRGIMKFLGKDEALRQANRLLNMDGGPGSGNFGHKGRPGKIGWSGAGGGSAFRTSSSGTASGYIGVQRTKAFKSIARIARSSKGYDDFIDGLSKEQRDLILEQCRSSGTKEGVREYTERLRQVMLSQKPAKKPVHKVVQGRELTEEPRWDGKAYVEPKYGQTIDTEIEHAIVQQGFNGPPKIVSQEEFDRIVKENPQMPILMRSYAAPTADVLQDYDDMLENGEWYVDCETGGAQYGQGMYCAGVYPQEPLYQWDDPGLELDPDNPFVVVNSKHEGFKAQKVTAEGNGDLYVDTPYLTSDKDGKRRMIRLDGESGMLEDIGNGGILEESEVDDLLRDGQVFQCEPVDIGIYEDAYDKERKKGIEAAKREMEEYRQLGIRRIYEEAEPQAPVGKLRTVEFDTNGDSVYRYYDPKNITTFGDNPPPNGTVVAMVDEYGIKRGLDANTWLYSNGRLISINGQNAIEASEIEQSWQWAPVEGKCPQPEIKPQASTRLMTLDPSSKIITYEEVKRIKNMASTIRREAQQELYDAELDYCDGKPEELYTLFQVMDGREVPDHMVAEAVEFKRKNPEACEEAIKWFSSQNEKYREKVRKADKYKRFSIADPGVIATELGYDAINAEGHGNSESYTVVLNRTKVIISEQRVDIA